MRSTILPSLLQQVYAHPFNIALSNGTLPKDVFETFLRQDILYLIDFSQALQYLAPRLSEKKHNELCSELSAYVLKEMPFLYDFPSYSDTPSFFQPRRILVKKNEAVTNYTHFLIDNAKNKPIEIAVASILPCFYLYSELGKQMAKNDQDNNPYKEWIESYTHPVFLSYTQQFIDIFDTVATECEQENMINALKEATGFEIKLWDSVYPTAIPLDIKSHLCVEICSVQKDIYKIS